MGALDEILKALPVDQIAQQIGVSPDQVRAAASSAVPTVLGGMQANAQDPGGAASLGQALDQHDGSLLDSLDSGGGLDQIDTAEGEKIAGHVFGDNQEQVVQQLGSVTGGDSSMVKKLIPIIAPVVMAYLAKQMKGGGAGASGAAASAGGGLGGGLGDILGQVLGGAGGSGGGNNPLGGALGAVLGGLLGGGRKQ